MIPETVMDRLKVPDPLPGVGVQTDYGFSKQVIAFPMSAIKVAIGRADWQVDQASFRVGCERTPDVRGTRVRP